MTTAMTSGIAAAAGELVTSLMLRPWGQVSPSIYETGRLVSLAPWLTGHQARIAYLTGTQREDGAWGAPDGYGLVPTLSATEGLLSALSRADHGADRGHLAYAAERGVRMLATWLGQRLTLPDMPAIEHIVPSLVTLINQRITHLTGHPPLPLPEGMSEDTLRLVRSWIKSGMEIPEKLLHALEIAGEEASGAPGIRPTPIGTIGASPAATAAWLRERSDGEASEAARGHLEAIVRLHGGPVPVGLPITMFERGWVLSWLGRAGVPVDVPPEMAADLRAAIGPSGTPAGSGLPADADTTAVALYALALLGVPCEPDSLWHFRSGGHFSTWPGEQGVSVSVNAHVLDAFGEYVARKPTAAPRYGQAIRDLAAWIRERQRPDGSWTDRWHASPYYATVSCALALDAFGGEPSAASVRAAVAWVLDTQRPDGSWGRWEGTAEETAYAMQTLLMTRSRWEPRCVEAAGRGQAYLARSAGKDHPPLWHDKDLYTPLAVTRAAVITAQHLAERACRPSPDGALP
ncbi:prenyltransferase/squalene oxidase-like repeat protein [Nonomuraea polychroma]|uniref:Prenyltransferase/squalene oxidase-like repeat protein n=1 Tax=Nonomuraea polychroma TaxID=46176 RepID=A0A438MAP2_9ACTN|nr:prenyltransferase/squalene oxidase repeat-containing protein [Nonomuraea polychroma]RVX42799.1 prenyltransferase/squalene oxidase-like repeat protein [Nonomuraea polychroma]